MIIKNSKIPKMLSLVINVYAIALWPFVFIRDEGDEFTIIHEKIHLAQQKELLLVGFYFLYGLFWLYNFIKTKDKKDAYYRIPFEKEAYIRSHETNYLSKRKPYAWIKYL